MTGEINRVANEKVTVWAKIVTWIYRVIFGNPHKLKKFQTPEEQLESADAFEAMRDTFSSVPGNSMDNSEILTHAKRKFQK